MGWFTLGRLIIFGLLTIVLFEMGYFFITREGSNTVVISAVAWGVNAGFGNVMESTAMMKNGTFAVSYSVKRQCGELLRNALIVTVDSINDDSMVNLRRFCEIAGTVYSTTEWKLRV